MRAASARTAAAVFSGVGQIAAAQPEEGQQAVDVHPAGVGAVPGEGELVLLARQRQALDEAQAAVDAREAAAVVLDPPGHDLPAERGARGAEPAQQGGIDGGAERVDVVHQQRPQARAARRAGARARRS